MKQRKTTMKKMTMKKFLALALAMLLMMSMTGCLMGPFATVFERMTETAKSGTEESVIQVSSSEEAGTGTSSAVEEAGSSETTVSEKEKPFEPVKVEGEGSIYFTVDGEVLVEFSLPTETPIYSSINHTERYLAIMTHAIMEGVGGRTIVELYSGAPADYIKYYKSIMSMNNSTTTVTKLDGREVRICKSVEKVINAQNREVYEIDYLAAVAVNEDTVLGFRIEAAHATDSKIVFDDSVIEILLSHCVFG